MDMSQERMHRMVKLAESLVTERMLAIYDSSNPREDATDLFMGLGFAMAVVSKTFFRASSDPDETGRQVGMFVASTIKQLTKLEKEEGDDAKSNSEEESNWTRRS